ncbi:MAG TPA: hypothetical protein VLD57_05520, partial [Blastocatellia bacterium]|nr:hypothetical protein [Blastocatellia bacterium]
MAAAVKDTHQQEIYTDGLHPTVSSLRRPLIEGEKSYGEVTEDICQLLDRKPGIGWWVAFCVSFCLTVAGAIATAHTVTTG